MSDYWNVLSLLAEEEKVDMEFLEETRYLGFLVKFPKENRKIKYPPIPLEDPFLPLEEKVKTNQSNTENEANINNQKGEQEKNNEKANNEQKENEKEKENENDNDNENETEIENEDEDQSDSNYCCGLNKPEESWIECDRPRCKKKWFHFGCVGIEDNEDEDVEEEWYCPDCQEIIDEYNSLREDLKLIQINYTAPTNSLASSIPLWFASSFRSQTSATNTTKSPRVSLIIPYHYSSKFRSKVLTSSDHSLQNLKIRSKYYYYSFLRMFQHKKDPTSFLQIVSLFANRIRLIGQLEPKLHNHINNNDKFIQNSNFSKYNNFNNFFLKNCHKRKENNTQTKTVDIKMENNINSSEQITIQIQKEEKNNQQTLDKQLTKENQENQNQKNEIDLKKKEIENTKPLPHIKNQNIEIEKENEEGKETENEKEKETEIVLTLNKDQKKRKFDEIRQNIDNLNENNQEIKKFRSLEKNEANISPKNNDKRKIENSQTQNENKKILLTEKEKEKEKEQQQKDEGQTTKNQYEKAESGEKEVMEEEDDDQDDDEDDDIFQLFFSQLELMIYHIRISNLNTFKSWFHDKKIKIINNND
ncbi:inhibitor of growth protein [Anaeramoeba flamelloides]|uniref:Inhibitor of growth protein n=1 Tax=Anaeramoeba flamelloides TaxID=1746091 RepID=A0ABQ8XB00_9EUKA|nr:inhibitor of growth protein [Anaeramoeba flamelloides]